MNDNDMLQADEISLFDLVETLRDGWKSLVGGAVLGLAGAVVALMVTTLKFEASAVVQVGQVGQVGQASPIPVESPAQTVERLKSPSFQLAVAKVLGDEIWARKLSESSAETAKYISVQLMKTAPVIELKASAETPEKARGIAEAVIVELANKQNEIAKPMLDKMRSDLAITREKLASAERELEGLSKMMATAGVKDERFTQLSLITSLRVQKEAEIFGQRQLIMAHETALMPPATQPAKALESVYVGNKPVSPKKGIFLVLGLLGGLVGGCMAVFVADAWKRRRVGGLSVKPS